MVFGNAVVFSRILKRLHNLTLKKDNSVHFYKYICVFFSHLRLYDIIYIFICNHIVNITIGIVGRGNSTVVRVSVNQAGDPSSRPPRSVCVRKVEFYHCAIDLLPPVPTTGSKKAVHVILCLCNNACKRSLAICRKSRALCPVSRLLSVPI